MTVAGEVDLPLFTRGKLSNSLWRGRFKRNACAFSQGLFKDGVYFCTSKEKEGRGIGFEAAVIIGNFVPTCVREGHFSRMAVRVFGVGMFYTICVVVAVVLVSGFY